MNDTWMSFGQKQKKNTIMILNLDTSSFSLNIGPQSEIEFVGSRSHFQVDWGPDSDSPWPSWSDTTLRLFSN